MRRLIARRMGWPRGVGGAVRKRFDASGLYALSGLSGANWYETQTGGGEAGVASGFGFIVLARLWQNVASTTRAVSDNFYTGPVEGWTLNSTGTNNGAQVAFVSGAAASTASPTQTLSPSDHGRIVTLFGQHTGNSVRLSVFRGTYQVTAITGYTPSARKTALGKRANVGNIPADGVDILSKLTFRGTPSDTQIHALLDQVRLLGDLPTTFPLGTAGDEDIAALAPRHWYRGDGYVPSGGNLGGLTNRNTTVGGLMNVVGGTIALPSADTKLNGQLSVKFSPAGGYLETSLANSEFSFMHNGAGFHGVVVWVRDADQNQPLYGTTPLAGGTEIGTNVWMSTGGAYRLSVASNGTASVNNAASSSVQNDVGTYTESSYVNGASPEFFATDGAAVIASGTDSSPPTTNAPLQKFAIGASATGVVKGNCRIADVIIFDRRLSESERQKVRDYIRVRYGVGAITTTHRWSLRDVLRGLSLPVTDGQTAPANLPDTVTAATIDRMDRQGSPVVKIIDPSVDGRKSYGSLGHSATAYWQTAGVGGIAGVDTGWNLHVWVRPELLTGTRIWLGRGVGTLGYTVQMSGASLVVVPSNGAGAAAPGATKTISAGELSQPHLLSFVHTGAGNQTKTYWDGVLVGTAACVGYTPQAGPMYIGCYSAGQLPASGESIFAVGGGHAIHSDADIAAIYANVLRTGTLQRATGMDHLWDWTADIIANGGPENGVPLTVLDRIGTDHLTRVGGLVVASTSPAGLTGFGAQFYASSPTVALLDTPQWFVAMDVLLGDYGADGQTHYLLSKTNTTTLGLEIRILTGGALDIAYGTGSGRGGNANIVLTGPEKTSRIRILLQYDATGTVTTLYVGTAARMVTSNTVAYAAATSSALTVGTFGVAGTSPHGLMTVYGVQCGNALLNNTERDALLADTSFAAVAGKTVFRHWFPTDIAAAGGGVPVITRDRTGTVDLVRVGSGLQVAQRLEKLWSYEAA